MPPLLMILGTVLFIGIPVAAIAALLRCVQLEYRRDRVPILLYHRLLSKQDADAGRVPDDEMIWVCYDSVFADQMKYLRDAGYTTIDLDDYLNIREGRLPRPARPVIITFDDGYLSNYTMAYPALKCHGHKAVIFVAPEPDAYTQNIVRGVDGFLSPQQMRELAANGVSIQSHTLTHCVLNELPNDAVKYELTESRKRLESFTGKAVHHIAVPRAGGSRRVHRLIREAGYRTACGNAKGTANLSSHLLRLPRIVIERDMTVQDFASALTPKTALMLRIVGNIKRIPERLGGSGFAAAVRRVLYRSPLRPLFETRNLKKAVALAALAYLAGTAWFIWYLVASS